MQDKKKEDSSLKFNKESLLFFAWTWKITILLVGLLLLQRQTGFKQVLRYMMSPFWCHAHLMPLLLPTFKLMDSLLAQYRFRRLRKTKLPLAPRVIAKLRRGAGTGLMNSWEFLGNSFLNQKRYTNLLALHKHELISITSTAWLDISVNY